MGSEKASYWIAVSLLALFVSNNFTTRHEDEIRCLAARSLAAVERVSAHATGFVAMAETMLSRGETSFGRPQAALVDAQIRLASAQTAIASREAAFARIQAERAQMVAMQQLHTTVICPRQNLRLVVPQPPRDGTI
jgi:hypothetical protein